MVICRNAEEVHGQRKVGNPCMRTIAMLVILDFAISTIKKNTDERFVRNTFFFKCWAPLTFFTFGFSQAFFQGTVSVLSGNWHDTDDNYAQYTKKGKIENQAALRFVLCFPQFC